MKGKCLSSQGVFKNQNSSIHRPEASAISSILTFIYLLNSLGLSCSTQDLQSLLQHVGSGFLTKDQTLGAWRLIHWTTRQVPPPN